MLTRRSTARTSSPQGNSNWPELDDPKINKAMDAAELAPAEQRAQLWGDIDKQVTATRRRDPVDLGQAAARSSPSNVNGVIAQNNSQWDLAWTSLK